MKNLFLSFIVFAGTVSVFAEQSEKYIVKSKSYDGSNLLFYTDITIQDNSSNKQYSLHCNRSMETTNDIASTLMLKFLTTKFTDQESNYNLEEYAARNLPVGIKEISDSIKGRFFDVYELRCKFVK